MTRPLCHVTVTLGCRRHNTMQTEFGQVYQLTTAALTARDDVYGAEAAAEALSSLQRMMELTEDIVSGRGVPSVNHSPELTVSTLERACVFLELRLLSPPRTVRVRFPEGRRAG